NHIPLCNRLGDGHCSLPDRPPGWWSEAHSVCESEQDVVRSIGRIGGGHAGSSVRREGDSAFGRPAGNAGLAAIGMRAGGRLFRVVGQAKICSQRFRPTYSGTRWTDGSIGWLHGGSSCGGVNWSATRWHRGAGPRAVDMVTDTVNSETRMELNGVVAANIQRTVTILGATGSVGTSTIDLIKHQPDRYRVEAVTASRSAAALANLAREMRARFAAVADDSAYGELKDALFGTGIETGAGEAAVIEAAQRPADWVIGAISGAAGLKPTLAAAERGAIVALANKETLVCAGGMFMRGAAAAGATVLPVDSEHNALFQAMGGSRRQDVRRIILTASGGPFRNADAQTIRTATVAQALNPPNWSMGPKVTVDSAT